MTDAALPRTLVWSDDQEPGIRRRRSGRGFTYRGPSGRRIDDPETLAWIRGLAVPPAWTDVWICADRDGHLQATGRDARGRKQYRYHPQFRAHREAAKFERLPEVAEALPELRKAVAKDLVRPGLPREKVIATVVRLLEATLVRVGNEEYARENGSFGLTTLRDRHARGGPDGLRLLFKGKHGAVVNVAVHDRRLCRIVRRCQELPGQVLFQYLDEDDVVCPVSSTDVNNYMREATGREITAKDVRTWMGTLLTAVALAELPPPRSETQARRACNRVLEVVSSHLGNTPAVCRASYVHPAVLDTYTDGSLPRRWEAAAARGGRRLLAEERRLLHLLRTAPAPAARRRAA